MKQGVQRKKGKRKNRSKTQIKQQTIPARTPDTSFEVPRIMYSLPGI